MSLGDTISTPFLIVLNPASKAIAFINIIIRTVVPKKSVFKIKRKNLSVYMRKQFKKCQENYDLKLKNLKSNQKPKQFGSIQIIISKKMTVQFSL